MQHAAFKKDPGLSKPEESPTPRCVEPASPAASHDSSYPPALMDFMLQGWQEPSDQMPPQIKGLEHFQARRNALSDAFPAEVLVVPTGHEKVRNNDVTYPFRAGSDFYYLTGHLEPDSVLILVPRPQGGHEAILFVEPNPGRSDGTFFKDRFKGELWVGPRWGVSQSQHRYGMDRCEPLTAWPAWLEEIRSHRYGSYRLLRGHDVEVDRILPDQGEQDRALAIFLSEQRLIKDALEIEALRYACQSTRRGFEDIIAALPQIQTERHIEGIFNLRARLEGHAVGYNTIAAAGAHACILHWSSNTGTVGPHDLILIDAGVESHTLYTADVTRTLPVCGTYDATQRAVYEIVLAAQAAALAEVKPGNDFMAPNQAAMKVLTEGLVALGILSMSVQEALDPQNQFYRRFTLHNVSHMLGLDVHDCAQARQEAYKYGALQPGMVLTVEPGLYFQTDDRTVPALYRGIGIRIEDDVRVTETGCEILSDIPREAREVERWMQQVWARPHGAL